MKKNNFKRIFNYRPMVVLFIVLLFLSLLFLNIILENMVMIVISATAIVFMFVYLIIKKKIDALIAIAFISFLFCFAFYNLYYNYVNYYNFDNEELSIYGVISDEKTQYSYYKTVWIDGLIIDDTDFDGKLELTIIDYSGVFENIEIGTILYFSSEVDTNDIFYDEDSLDITNIKNLVKYSSSIYIDDLNIDSYQNNFANSFKNKVFSILSKCLTVENAQIMYSAMFGDKVDLDYSTSEIFSAAGISHLLAVSGLHIGILVLVISLILKKLKIKNWLNFLIISLFLLFYCYICNFSTSVVRAMIMSLTLLFANLIYKEYDSLSAISFAGILTLFICPVSAMDIGAMMSFGCVFSIALLYDYISKCLEFLNIKNKTNASLTISMCAQIGILGVMLMFFEKIQLLSILTNLLILPLFTFAFSVTFLIVFISLILPFFAYLLYGINFILYLITFIAKFVYSLSFAEISMYSIDYIAYLVYNAIIVLWSKYCMVNIYKKSVINISLCTIYVLLASQII